MNRTSTPAAVAHHTSKTPSIVVTTHKESGPPADVQNSRDSNIHPHFKRHGDIDISVPAVPRNDISVLSFAVSDDSIASAVQCLVEGCKCVCFLIDFEQKIISRHPVAAAI